MVTTYGNSLYNQANYGRVASEILAAQDGYNRQTGLKVQVLDNQINRWEEWAGTALQPSDLDTSTDHTHPTDQDYRWYRFQMSMCILGNGTIVRVRVGDGSLGNRAILRQEIYDPTVASQWTTWVTLYAGTHYAVAVVPATSSTYHVYSVKSDGVYKNNVLKQSITDVVSISPVQGQVDAMFVTKLRSDHVDGQRVMNLYYSPDIESTAFSQDSLNYRWRRTEISALLLDDGRVARAQVAGFYTDPRSTSLAESITICFSPAYNDIDPSGPPRIIRGFAGQAGKNTLVHPLLTKMNDGFYYLFYTETRVDANKNEELSTSQTVFWQRSLDLEHWSEPVAIGFDNMNPTGLGLVESGSYAYLANNGSVYRRPTNVVTYDISNYVPKITFETPRENQAGTASFSVANPEGVNDTLLDLTDCEVTIEAGIRCADAVYRYSEYGRWWIDTVDNDVNQKVNRLSIKLYDLWGRMDNKLRDVYNNVGCVVWKDWRVGQKNALFNYYLRGGTFSRVDHTNYKSVRVVDPTGKNCFLYTGVKSHNGEVSVRFRVAPKGRKLGVVYRYFNAKNYHWCYSDGDDIYLVRVQDGKSSTIGTDPSNVNGAFTLGVVFRWNKHYVYLNGVLQFTYTEVLSGTKPGFSGVRGTGGNFGFYQFYFRDWQPSITTSDLIRTLLAMSDFHYATIAGGDQEQLAIVWGPQTDLNTPAAALAALCDEYQLDLAWRGTVISVGQFKDLDPTFTLEDEIIEFKRTEEVGRRINLASVDGREDSWLEIDGADTRFRGRQIVDYFDVPELATDSDVRLRAQEEIRKGVVGSAYECTIPLRFDLWRMDNGTIVDNNGTSYDLRVEGFKVDISQTDQPSQRMTLDLSPLT